MNPTTEATPSMRPFGMRFLVTGTPRQTQDEAEPAGYDTHLQLTVTATDDPWALAADRHRGESTTDVHSDGNSTDHTDPY